MLEFPTDNYFLCGILRINIGIPQSHTFVQTLYMPMQLNRCHQWLKIGKLKIDISATQHVVFAIMIKLYGNILPLSGFLPQIVMRQFWKVSICFFFKQSLFSIDMMSAELFNHQSHWQMGFTFLKRRHVGHFAKTLRRDSSLHAL